MLVVLCVFALADLLAFLVHSVSDLLVLKSAASNFLEHLGLAVGAILEVVFLGALVWSSLLFGMKEAAEKKKKKKRRIPKAPRT
jgi:hypothetical protein